MSEEGHSGPAGKAAVTPEEAAELQHLLDELPTAAAAVVEALNLAADTPTGAVIRMYRERAARVNEMVDRINEIRG